MNSEAFVQLALEALSCNQKELASRLKVSPGQISKWKKGEYISPEMENKFRAIIGIGDQDPLLVFWTGSLDNANKWERLINHLAEMAQQNAETGYITYPLSDEMGILCGETLRALREMGVILPKEFPKELDFDYSATDNDEENEEHWNLIAENPYSALILEIYSALNDVYGFYVAYVAEFIADEELALFDTAADNIEPCLISLAATKIEVNHELAPNFGVFKRRVEKDYEEWLTLVKEKAFRNGIPLRAELLGLVYSSSGELGHEAEAESLGINSSRIHPDIYMNELLVGMRVIHQVLPTIMKKLGIDEGFELDSSDLRMK
ncbi:XRE family transcriptional regulator [Serratia inhibens]|uniref:XRE family transcriptional regulator n=1 Tax=Serratia inhibens TaxID=2338073 RepID=A0AA92X6U7_9GAMM|nr:XRE family transcriptional regulator [Serratia inhibens]RJF58292.1 XRE family transcriptional regulator [Serratia inhibens]